MFQEILQDHRTDNNGNPAGGRTTGTGIDIRWQDGPLGRGNERAVPNGAFVEAVIKAAIGRLEFYQNGQFSCEENAKAIEKLGEAVVCCRQRSADRITRGVEGTHAV